MIRQPVFEIDGKAGPRRAAAVASLTMILVTLLPAVFAFNAQAAPAHHSKFAVRHAWVKVPSGWEEHGVPSSDHPITMKIGLKQHRMDELIDTLYQVSDPLHPNYGKHLPRLYAAAPLPFSYS